MATRICFTRRAALGATSAVMLWPFVPRAALAEGARDLRLLVVVLRGALDGLAAVPPVADPAFLAARAPGPDEGDPIQGTHTLDGFFALHPAMPNLAASFLRGEALIAHATATGYRGRSHFDGQDVLESGHAAPGQVESGWLNRALARIPAERLRAHIRGLGVGVSAPLVIRGRVPVLGWAPPSVPPASDELARRALVMYGELDPALHLALASAYETESITGATGISGSQAALLTNLAGGAARLMGADDGPRIGACAIDGWDTHSDQGGAVGQIATLLGNLDGFLETLRVRFGPVWRDTIVVVITEFGRTVALNGTRGSDHGTGTIAILVGGAVKGARVIADWPGLRPRSLLDGRDLAPTLDLRSVLAGVLADGYGLSPTVIATDIFPDGERVAPLSGLLT